MALVVGVIVRKIKERIYAKPKHLQLSLNDKVIVETEHGVEFGYVFETEKELEITKDIKLAEIVRKANDHDLKRLQNNENKNQQALGLVLKKVKEFKLDLKLTTINYTFDRTKLFIYYTSESRVDFREFIKDLGHALKTRIQMVQIGVRDEAKIIGGISTCGQQLCCKTFLKEFSSVTIDMAKDQQLSLNTSKLSGLCGRLMCCLAYENDTYVCLRKKIPEMGSIVSTPMGKGTLKEINFIKETVNVEFSENNTKWFNFSQVVKQKK
ncbi:stage 0 sporulation family protein [Candidatus Ruminimicrobium bovinum]|uniref:PSP1 domain-containing protein n=1 Tax=Candidatus Ruminimicrobium bovinum TaxID=3242779 RepID=UPI0039B8AE1B